VGWGSQGIVKKNTVHGSGSGGGGYNPKPAHVERTGRTFKMKTKKKKPVCEPWGRKRAHHKTDRFRVKGKKVTLWV